ncbi:MAG: hypothetical protein ACXWH7_14165, partial [Thermoanaerobaculia bacterium]
ALRAEWDNALIPRDLTPRERDFASDFASFASLARCTVSCAWNTPLNPWNILLLGLAVLGVARLFPGWDQRREIVFVEHVDQVRDLAPKRGRQTLASELMRRVSVDPAWRGAIPAAMTEEASIIDLLLIPKPRSSNASVNVPQGGATSAAGRAG